MPNKEWTRWPEHGLTEEGYLVDGEKSEQVVLLYVHPIYKDPRVKVIAKTTKEADALADTILKDHKKARMCDELANALEGLIEAPEFHAGFGTSVKLAAQSLLARAKEQEDGS